MNTSPSDLNMSIRFCILIKYLGCIKGNLVGQNFLLDIMQIREDIENTTSQGKLKNLFHDNEKTIYHTCSLLSTAFLQNNQENKLKYTAQLQYWKRIRETLVEKMSAS